MGRYLVISGVISGASAAYYLSNRAGKKVTKKVVRFVKELSKDPQRST